MGHAIEALAKERGHDIAAILDTPQQWLQQKQAIENSDVIIDFSIPGSAVDNLSKAFEYKTPVVCGTTGWLHQLDKITTLCNQNNGALLYASNFSIGVNLFFEVNKKLATLMGDHPEYKPAIEETHHIHKLDAPSGTAITLCQQITHRLPHINDWALDATAAGILPVHAIRRGEVNGTHQVKYSSSIDEIEIIHRANNRKGFALGAVMGAEWLINKTGVFTMYDMLFGEKSS